MSFNPDIDAELDKLISQQAALEQASNDLEARLYKQTQEAKQREYENIKYDVEFATQAAKAESNEYGTKGFEEIIKYVTDDEYKQAMKNYIG